MLFCSRQGAKLAKKKSKAKGADPEALQTARGLTNRSFRRGRWRAATDGFASGQQRIDPATGRPEGEPFAAAHFHHVRLFLSGVPIPMMGVAIASDRIILNLSEMSGDLWMAQTPGK
jgi:hypothetical protein